MADAGSIVLGLQDEIRRSEESRYDHRLHGILLVAQGLTSPEVAGLLGDAPRTVEYWVRGFEERGLAGLLEGERSGRPRRLTEKQLQAVNRVLRQAPCEGVSGNIWDGKTLSAWIEQQHGIKLGVRQCLFRQLGFRLRKPRPAIAQANPEWQRAHKKTPATHEGRPRRSVVHRRSALSTARFALPNVDSAGNQRPCFATCADKQERGVFRRGSLIRWPVRIPPRGGQIQWRHLFPFPPRTPPHQHPNGSPRHCHYR